MKCAIAIIVIAAIYTIAFGLGFLIGKCIYGLTDVVSSIKENANRKYVLSVKNARNQYVFDYSYQN